MEMAGKAQELKRMREELEAEITTLEDQIVFAPKYLESHNEDKKSKT